MDPKEIPTEGATRQSSSEKSGGEKGSRKESSQEIQKDSGRTHSHTQDKDGKAWCYYKTHDGCYIKVRIFGEYPNGHWRFGCAQHQITKEEWIKGIHDRKAY